jgi:hypothetical protein
MTRLSDVQAGIWRCSLGAEDAALKWQWIVDAINQVRAAKTSHHEKPRDTHLPCLMVFS